MQILIFGDQTADCRTFLSAVFRRKGDVLLNSFLEQASNAIREEISRSRGIASNIPSFGTIQELTERYFRNGASNAAIESTLLCVAQLAHYIG